MTSVDQRKISNLRVNSFVALFIILIEIGIGMGVNLFAALPTDDVGKALFASFGHAVASGPLVLTIHALVGTVIVISGITAVVRALSVGRATPTVLSCIAMLAVLVAWLSGSRFVGAPDNGASMSMTVAAVIAASCYAIIVFVLPATPGTSRQGK